MQGRYILVETYGLGNGAGRDGSRPCFQGAQDSFDAPFANPFGHCSASGAGRKCVGRAMSFRCIVASPNGNSPQTRALVSSGQSRTLVFNHRPPCMFPLEALFQENISLAEVDPEPGPGCQVDREEAEAGSSCKHICHIVIGTASGWGEWWWWQFGW